MSRNGFLWSYSEGCITTAVITSNPTLIKLGSKASLSNEMQPCLQSLRVQTPVCHRHPQRASVEVIFTIQCVSILSFYTGLATIHSEEHQGNSISILDVTTL
jgi:hypothetical protein